MSVIILFEADYEPNPGAQCPMRKNVIENFPEYELIKRIVNLIFKNKNRRCKMKILIKRSVPQSSAWHNFLSTEYCKIVFCRQANECRFWKSPCYTRKSSNFPRHGAKKHVKLDINKAKISNSACIKCKIPRLNASDKYCLFICGDIELNPGPPCNPLSILTTRLARMGLAPVNIVGDGNCFFRSVSHQIYHTETRHAQIRAVAIQHLINCPEHFIESNTDHSWMQYLQNMSTLGTWADHIIIQALANSHNLRIHIIESTANFSERTNVSSIYASERGGNARDIYIGHLDEMHYILTASICPNTFTDPRPSTVANSTKANKKPSDKSTIDNLKSRKEYMREYMKKKRMNSEFKTKENERKITYNRKYRQLNPESLRESKKRSNAAYKQRNAEKLKESEKRSIKIYRQNNPGKLKEFQKRAIKIYRQSNPEKLRESQKKVY